MAGSLPPDSFVDQPGRHDLCGIEEIAAVKEQRSPHPAPEYIEFHLAVLRPIGHKYERVRALGRFVWISDESQPLHSWNAPDHGIVRGNERPTAEQRRRNIDGRRVA